MSRLFHAIVVMGAESRCRDAGAISARRQRTRCLERRAGKRGAVSLAESSGGGGSSTSAAGGQTRIGSEWRSPLGGAGGSAGSRPEVVPPASRSLGCRRPTQGRRIQPSPRSGLSVYFLQRARDALWLHLRVQLDRALFRRLTRPRGPATPRAGILRL